MKFISLVSSGIDSPVATYLLSSKAEEIILVHADNRPFTDEREIEKFITLAKHLKSLVCCRLSAVIVPHGPTLRSYTSYADPKFTCVVCKRMMLRYAEALAKQEHADAIIMGDTLGQVASQTLQNILVVEQAVTIPILRPLIGFDKEDTIRIAKKIGSFDLSIIPAAACGAVPDKPSTRAQLSRILDEEKKIDVQALVTHAIGHAITVTL